MCGLGCWALNCLVGHRRHSTKVYQGPEGKTWQTYSKHQLYSQRRILKYIYIFLNNEVHVIKLEQKPKSKLQI